MTDLIIHIGLPKTATTTLQNKIFAGIPGYLGTKDTNRRVNDFGKQFNAITPSKSINEWEKDVRSWANRVIAYKNEFHANCNRLFLSSENLSRNSPVSLPATWPICPGHDVSDKVPHQCKRAIIPHLEKLKEDIWVQGDVKVILVLRNQADWLASLYAQRAKDFKKASQRDFEEKIRRIIENDDDYIDWSQWVHDLQNALGEKNVTVLLMEDMERKEFWRKLSQVLAIDSIEPNQNENENTLNANILSSDKTFWKLQTYKGRSKAVTRFFKDQWTQEKLPRLRSLARAIAKEGSRYILDPLEDRIANPGGRRKIQLTEELRNQVRTYCRPCNDRLANQLGRSDLKELGY